MLKFIKQVFCRHQWVEVKITNQYLFNDGKYVRVNTDHVLWECSKCKKQELYEYE